MTSERSNECEQSNRLIEFAPLWIPWTKRLETLCTLLYMSIWSLFGFGPALLLYNVFFTRYWYVGVAYATWIFYDRNIGRTGGRRSEWFRKTRFLKLVASYFPIRLVKTTELDSSRNYVMGYHPHGLFCTGLCLNFGPDATNVTKVFPGIKMHVLTLDFSFRIPFFREFILAPGGCSVSQQSMNFLLSKKGGGNSVLVVPGGAREALHSLPDKDVVYLRNRKGFVKVAIKNGAPLVPIYAFGENDIYSLYQFPKGSWVRTFQEKFIDLFAFVPIPFNGRGIFQYSFGLLPRRRPITAVVGEPIFVQQFDSPSQAYIDEVHGQYVSALSAVYYAHRDKYGHANSELIII